jgi:hypothetical protein
MERTCYFIAVCSHYLLLQLAFSGPAVRTLYTEATERSSVNTGDDSAKSVSLLPCHTPVHPLGHRHTAKLHSYEQNGETISDGYRDARWRRKWKILRDRPRGHVYYMGLLSVPSVWVMN